MKSSCASHQRCRGQMILVELWPFTLQILSALLSNILMKSLGNISITSSPAKYRMPFLSNGFYAVMAL